MSQPSCGCNSSGSENEFLLIKATASEASVCGTGEAATGTESCAKQEPMFDYSLSDFLVPLTGSTTNMIVCNPSVYTVGLWLQFVDPVVTLRIVNISGKTIALSNACDDGADIDSNPSPGLAISRNSAFVVVAEPPCETDEEEWERMSAAFSTATEICMENLGQASETAIVHPVGRVDSDPSNLGVGKCLKRLYGFVMKAGRPFFSALGNPIEVNADSVSNYRPVVKHKTTNGLFHRKNYSEDPALVANKPYQLGVYSGSEQVSPGYLFMPMDKLIEESGPPISFHLSGLVVANSLTKDFEISANAPLPNANSLDHYYILARLETGAYTSGAPIVMESYLNNKLMAHNWADAGDFFFMSISSASAPIKVLKSDNKVTLKLLSNDSIKAYYRLQIDGIYY